MQTLALSLDLIDDADAIAAYEAHHRAVWPEIEASFRASGIARMEIYRVGTRLFMHLVVEEHFSFERKAALDAGDAKVVEWEALMDRYQRRLPGSPVGAKWTPMSRVYRFQGEGAERL